MNIYELTEQEVIQYKQYHTQPTRLTAIWHDIISKLPKEVQEEATQKPFQIIGHPLLQKDQPSFSRTDTITIPQASQKLHKALEELEIQIIVLI